MACAGCFFIHQQMAGSSCAHSFALVTMGSQKACGLLGVLYLPDDFHAARCTSHQTIIFFDKLTFCLLHHFDGLAKGNAACCIQSSQHAARKPGPSNAVFRPS